MKPPSVREARPETPPEVAAVVEKLLAKHPGERYQTPAELAEALEPFAVSGPTPWAPLPPPAEPFVDSLATPLADVVADADVSLLSSGELSALENTLPQGASPTPRAPAPSRIRPRPRVLPWWKSRLPLLVLLCGCALVLGLTALAGVLLLLTRLHFPWH